MGIKKYTIGSFETNTYIITKGNKCVIVDPALSFNLLLDEIKGYEVVAILLTHGHLDHIDGIGFVDAPIYISSYDLVNLSDYSYSLYSLVGIIPSYNFNELKINTLEDNDIIYFGDFTFKVIHTPGHTKGSVCYLYYDNLFTGDTLFKESIGRTDLPGGSYKDINKSLEKLIHSVNGHVKIYPGHGENSNFKAEKENNPYLLKIK